MKNNNNFEALKIEVEELIENNLTNNEKGVIDFINTTLSKFDSKLTVRKNMSIDGFKTLLLNSNTPEQFKGYLSKLDTNKDYSILDDNTLKESFAFNEECKNDDIEKYELYKRFLEGHIKFNDNLYVAQYI